MVNSLREGREGFQGDERTYGSEAMQTRAKFEISYGVAFKVAYFLP